eukprot:PhM_4_TR7611/c0_g1_i1/m.5089
MYMHIAPSSSSSFSFSSPPSSKWFGRSSSSGVELATAAAAAVGHGVLLCEIVNTSLAANVACAVESCRKVTLSATTCTSCRCLLCHSCYFDLIQESKTCPACGGLLSVANPPPPPPLMVSLLLRTLEVRCPYKGCTVTREASEMHHHVVHECDFSHPRTRYWRQQTKHAHHVLRYLREMKRRRDNEVKTTPNNMSTPTRRSSATTYTIVSPSPPPMMLTATPSPNCQALTRAMTDFNLYKNRQPRRRSSSSNRRTSTSNVHDAQEELHRIFRRNSLNPHTACGEMLYNRRNSSGGGGGGGGCGYVNTNNSTLFDDSPDYWDGKAPPTYQLADDDDQI